MSDLIPSVNWTDLVEVVKAGKLKELKSSEVIYNGECICTIIIYRGDPDTDGSAKVYSERIALRTNMQGGKDPQELLAEIEGKAGGDFICSECERSFKIKVALVGHMRTHRVKVMV